MGKIIIEHIRARNVTSDSLNLWLQKYGTIINSGSYGSTAVVQFSSDLEAAGAVQCEDGRRRYGGQLVVRHAEPEDLLKLEGQDRKDRTAFSNNTRIPEAAAPYSSDTRPRHRYISSRDSDLQSRDRYKRRSSHSRSPERTRRSSPSPVKSDNRHVHPLTWLSQAADKITTRVPKYPAPISEEPAPAAPNPAVSDRPYDVAILAITHDLVPYAEAVRDRMNYLQVPVSTESMQGETRSPSTHIIVLISVDHLTPCIQDLTNDHVLFAIIVDAVNWTHNSCTLRILNSATQEEHRNMALVDALSLLGSHFATILNQQLRSKPIAELSPEKSLAPVDDPTFIAPSKHIAALLRMLADCRLLSVGELDELANFIAERRARQCGRLVNAPECAAALFGDPELFAQLKVLLGQENVFPKSRPDGNSDTKKSSPLSSPLKCTNSAH